MHSFKNNMVTRNTRKTVFVKFIIRYIEGKQILKYLYKASLITRVKTTNGKVGRKYARYEQCL